MTNSDFRYRALTWMICFVFTSMMNDGAFSQKTVVGYYPSWKKSTFPYTSIRYRNLTHIAHAFIAAKTDGSLEIPAGFLYPEMVQAAHQYRISLVVSVGGWGDYSTRFAPMSADTAARRRFVANLKAFCLANDYDGVDIDWEYPKNATERTNLQLLIRDLRTAFNTESPPLQIGMAMPATNWSGQWYDVAGMSNDVNWFGIMTYDFYGTWTSTSGPNAALYGNFSTNSEGWIDYSVDYYKTTRGVPAQKLLIGLPFYGWMYNAASMYGPSTGASQLEYRVIAPKLQQGWSRSWDSEGLVPYMRDQGQTQVISYDDSVSIGLKCDYINSKPVGGAIIWAIGQDEVGGRQPLMETVGARLGLPSGAYAVVDRGIPEAFLLSQNYPNPFNGQSRIQYTVPHDCHVTIAVYDMLGREVKVLANRGLKRGIYEATISSDELVSGVYYYRLSTGTISLTRAFVLIR